MSAAMLLTGKYLWSDQRQHEILPGENELAELNTDHSNSSLKQIKKILQQGFIAESPEKLRKIYSYYAAFYGRNPFPYKKCNAPWVSTVIEADGTVRPCFFHAPMGNIREQSLDKILNSERRHPFPKELDMEKNDTCIKCVCYLNLSPGTKLI